MYMMYNTYLSVNLTSNSKAQSIRVAKFDLLLGLPICFPLRRKKLEVLDVFFPD